MPKGLNLDDRIHQVIYTHSIVDDFYAEDTNVWTTTATDSGTSTVGDSAGGVVALQPSDGTVADNDEIYLLTKEVYLFAAGKPLYGKHRVQFTEASTDDANVFVGFGSGIAANFLVDNGGGPAASFSGVGFYKVDGGTNWNVIFSLGSTQEKVELNAAASLTKSAQTAGGAAYQLLEIEVVPTTSALCDVFFYIDGVAVYTMKGKTFTSATEMSAVYALKNGGANQETLNVDLHVSAQKR
jgi:hypothetical protein